ncbi:hypothetical protein G6F68_013960 [Rhizopus microsporus]|nr:hypothetical protein G6F68_013960 [Rhizopus microsporus]
MPNSALAAGVKMGSGTWLACCRPAGSLLPQMAPDRLQALDHDGAAAHLVHFVRGHHVFGLHARGVVRQDVGQLLQPEFGQLGQHLSLAGNGIVKNHVEGGDTIRRDDQQLVVAHRVHIAHLTAAQQRQGLDAGLMQSRSHGNGLWQK